MTSIDAAYISNIEIDGLSLYNQFIPSKSLDRFIITYLEQINAKIISLKNNLKTFEENEKVNYYFHIAVLCINGSMRARTNKNQVLRWNRLLPSEFN